MPRWETIHSVTGLFMGRIGLVRVTCMTPQISEQTFNYYLELLAREIDQTPLTQRMGVFDHAPEASLTAERRNSLGILLKSRAEKLRQITAGYAMVTPSFVVRGALKAIWWMAPPPYPSTVVATTRAGFDAIARWVPGEDAGKLDDTYAAIMGGLSWLSANESASPG